MNLCLSLITQGHEDTAFTMLKTFPTLQAETSSTDVPSQGNFFLRHCVNMDVVSTDREGLGMFCLHGMHLYLFSVFSLSSSLSLAGCGEVGCL